MDLRNQMNKMEKMISDFATKRLDTSRLTEPENFNMVVVDIFDNKYGKRCEISILFNKPFKEKDSDLIHNQFRGIKKELNEFTAGFFKDGITSSQATIDSYLQYKDYRINF